MESNKPEIHITDENSPQIKISEQPTPEEKPKELTNALKLQTIGELGRKLGYWIDEDIELPKSITDRISMAFNYLKQIDKYLTEQMVDIHETLNEDGSTEHTKSIPTKPELLTHAKAMGRNKFKDAPSKAKLFVSKWYKQNGGSWKKRGLKKKKKNDK